MGADLTHHGGGTAEHELGIHLFQLVFLSAVTDEQLNPFQHGINQDGTQGKQHTDGGVCKIVKQQVCDGADAQEPGVISFNEFVRPSVMLKPNNTVADDEHCCTDNQHDMGDLQHLPQIENACQLEQYLKDVDHAIDKRTRCDCPGSFFMIPNLNTVQHCQRHQHQRNDGKIINENRMVFQQQIGKASISKPPQSGEDRKHALCIKPGCTSVLYAAVDRHAKKEQSGKHNAQAEHHFRECLIERRFVYGKGRTQQKVRSFVLIVTIQGDQNDPDLFAAIVFVQGDHWPDTARCANCTIGGCQLVYTFFFQIDLYVMVIDKEGQRLPLTNLFQRKPKFADHAGGAILFWNFFSEISLNHPIITAIPGLADFGMYHCA